MRAKNNQKALLKQIGKTFEITKPSPVHTECDIRHGRNEIRTCRVIDNLQHFDDYKDWPGLKTLVEITAQRVNRLNDEKEASKSYYISSKVEDAKTFYQNIRSRWAIENKLH